MAFGATINSEKMIVPERLIKGDWVYLTAPAKAIAEKDVLAAKEWLMNQGFHVEVAKNCLGQHHYFSGTDQERTTDFQEGLDNPKYKAILCARGGYGCARIVEELDWTQFAQHPKWIIGFSDVTVFHHKTLSLGIQSIHSTMAFGIQKNTPFSLTSLSSLLFKGEVTVVSTPHPLNRLGSARGRLIGGNLTIVYSLLATQLKLDFRDNILFIEEVGEHVYKIDRMLQTLEMNGVFDQISGLVVGGITEPEDTTPPFGKDIETLICERVKHRDIPVCFGFPAGHGEENHAMCLGSNVVFETHSTGASLLM